jgi:hypothetical protein
LSSADATHSLPDALNLLVRHHAAVSGCPSTQGSGQKRLLWGADPRGRIIERALRIRSDEAKCCVLGENDDAKESRASSQRSLHIGCAVPSLGLQPVPCVSRETRRATATTYRVPNAVLFCTSGLPEGGRKAPSRQNPQSAVSFTRRTSDTRFHVKHCACTATAPEGQAQGVGPRAVWKRRIPNNRTAGRSAVLGKRSSPCDVSRETRPHTPQRLTSAMRRAETQEHLRADSSILTLIHLPARLPNGA